MQIRIDDAQSPIHTTLAELLEALQAVTESDGEIEAVLVSMLDQDRIHFISEPALAA